MEEKELGWGADRDIITGEVEISTDSSNILIREIERADGDSPVIVQGQGNRKGTTNTIVPLPEDLHARLKETGSLAASAVGLIKYALDRIDAEGKTLIISQKK